MNSTTRNKLPAIEAGICRRLRMLRESLGMSQSEFAARIGVTRNVLANYEWERVPLKWLPGQLTCTQFKVNPHWLAAGEGEMHDADGASWIAGHVVPTNWNFSKALPMVTQSPALRDLPTEGSTAARSKTEAVAELNALVQFASLNLEPEDLKKLAGMWEQALISFRKAILTSMAEKMILETVAKQQKIISDAVATGVASELKMRLDTAEQLVSTLGEFSAKLHSALRENPKSKESSKPKNSQGGKKG